MQQYVVAEFDTVFWVFLSFFHKGIILLYLVFQRSVKLSVALYHYRAKNLCPKCP